MKTNKKPPIGLIPKKFHDEQRHNEVVSAIRRYLKARKEVPQEWIEEYHEYIRKLFLMDSLASLTPFPIHKGNEFPSSVRSEAKIPQGEYKITLGKENKGGFKKRIYPKIMIKGDGTHSYAKDIKEFFESFECKNYSGYDCMSKSFYYFLNNEGNICTSIKPIKGYKVISLKDISSHLFSAPNSNLDEIEEIHWLCNKDLYMFGSKTNLRFKKGKKYKQLSNRDNFIVLIDEKEIEHGVGLIGRESETDWVKYFTKLESK